MLSVPSMFLFVAVVAVVAPAIHVGDEPINPTKEDCGKLCQLFNNECTFSPPLGFNQPEGFDAHGFCRDTCKDEKGCSQGGPSTVPMDDKPEEGDTKSDTESDEHREEEMASEGDTESDEHRKEEMGNDGDPVWGKASESDAAVDKDGANRRRSRRRGGKSPDFGKPLPVPASPPTLEEAVTRLWEIETPFRLVPGKGLKLNLQSQSARNAISRDGRLDDRAPDPLITSVDENGHDVPDPDVEEAFDNLLDNYKRDNKEVDDCKDKCKEEQARFIEKVGKTDHMKYAYSALQAWQDAGYLPSLGYGWGGKFPDYETFLSDVQSAWFTPYYQGTSSGFEHVFVGEEKKKRSGGGSEISGLHSWRQYHRLEKMGKINYLGYRKKPDPDNLMLSIKFEWKDDDPDIEIKPISTFLMGTTTAFDFSLATIIFFAYGDTGSLDTRDKPNARIAGHQVKFTCYTYKERNTGPGSKEKQQYVRTSYVE